MAEESKLAEKLKDSTKFSEEEMKTVKEIQQRYVDVQHKLGQLSVEETDFIKSITEKYGDGVLNPETGEYNKK